MVHVRILVTLKPSLLDSAGRTVTGALDNLGFSEVEDVRIGKAIVVRLKEYDEARVRAMCDKLARCATSCSRIP